MSRARHFKPWMVLALYLVLLCPSHGAAALEPLGGGFEATPLFVLTQGLMPYPSSNYQPLRPGRLSSSTNFIWTNTLRVDEDLATETYTLLLDAEGLTLHDELRVGLVSGVELSAWVEGSSLFPGILDGALSGFHKFFGFANQRRSSVADGGSDFLVSTPRGYLLDYHDSALGLTNLGLGLSFLLPLPQEILATLRVKIPLPMAEPWILPGEAAYAISLATGATHSIFEASLALGLALQDASPRRADLPAIDLLLQGSGRLGLRLGTNFLVGIEVGASDSPYDTKDFYLGGMAGNLWLGCKTRLFDAWTLELALIEELASWASVEVGFQIGLGYSGNLHR